MIYCKYNRIEKRLWRNIFVPEVQYFTVIWTEHRPYNELYRQTFFCFYLGFESRIHGFSQASDFTLRHPSRWCHQSSDSMSIAMSKSSIKTKTVLTMTDMTQSTELQTFIRQKDGYKVTVKISLCICVVLSWDELEVRQNLLDSDYEIYMVRLLVATVNWHKSSQFAKNLT